MIGIRGHDNGIQVDRGKGYPDPGNNKDHQQKILESPNHNWIKEAICFYADY